MVVVVVPAWVAAGGGLAWEAAAVSDQPWVAGGRVKWSLVGSADQCARRSSFGGSKETSTVTDGL